jgi:hypothetical protein
MKTTEAKCNVEASTKAKVSETTKPTESSEEQRKCISTCAYFKAQARGFAPGHEIDDWVQAEAEIATQEQVH